MPAGEFEAGRQVMRFEENRDAGWGVREFHNREPAREGPRPGHIDLGWSSKVIQNGTSNTTGIQKCVAVYYCVGRRKRTFRDAEANCILRAVQQSRSDRQ